MQALCWFKVSGSRCSSVKRNGSNPVIQAFQTGTTSPILEVLADGPATFAGISTFGTYDVSSASETGVQVNSGGVVRVQRGSSAGSSAEVSRVTMEPALHRQLLLTALPRLLAL